MDPFAPSRNALQLYMQTASLPAQTAQTIAMDRRQQEQNAMANAMRALQMEEIQRRMQKEQGMDNALSTLFSRQRQPGTGPMRGVADYQPGAMQTPNPAYTDIRSKLAPFGVEGLSVAEKFKPEAVNPYEGLDKGYETFLRANQIPNSPQAYADYQRNVIEQKKAGATNVTTNVGGPMTPGRKKTDEAFAEEYNQYVAAGGFADVQKQIGQLDEVIKNLSSGKNLTGPVIGSIPDAVLKYSNPEAIETREAVEEVVQRNLRAVLGAQFTNEEGVRLIKRAFNPNLSEQENLKRVRRLSNQMKAAARAKESAARYFEENGTLTGWKGKKYTLDDFTKMFPAVDGEEKAAGEIKFLGFE